MDLVGIIISEINQKKANTVWSLICRLLKKKNKKNNQQTRAGNPKFIDKETGSLAARGGGEWWRK